MDTTFAERRGPQRTPAGEWPTGRDGGSAPRVAVVGIGAVGGYFAVRAAVTGCDVALCVRRPIDRLQVIYSGTAGPDGKELVSAPPTRIVTDPNQLDGPADWVLVATKAHQTPSAIPWLTQLVGPDTVVVVAQNGVRHVERVSPPVPVDQVLPAVVYVNAELTTPGVVRHRAYGFLQVPDVEAGKRLAESVLTGDGEVRLVEDFHTVAWEKLTANCAANSLTALTGRRLEVLGRDDVAELALAVMKEATAVAKADGAEVRPDLPEFTIRRIRAQPPDAGTSMLFDRLAGRPLEHENLIGAVVRIGAEHQVPTPVSRVLLTLLAAVGDGNFGPVV